MSIDYHVTSSLEIEDLRVLMAEIVEAIPGIQSRFIFGDVKPFKPPPWQLEEGCVKEPWEDYGFKPVSAASIRSRKNSSGREVEAIASCLYFLAGRSNIIVTFQGEKEIEFLGTYSARDAWPDKAEITRNFLSSYFRLFPEYFKELHPSVFESP